MSIDKDDTTAERLQATDVATRPTPRTLRRTGWLTLATAAALASTPLFVFIIPWQLIYPETAGITGADPLVRDPAFVGRQPLEGVFMAGFGVVFAVAIVAAALSILPRTRSLSRLAGLQLGAAVTAAALELVETGMNGTMHSALQAGFGDSLASMQPDASIREMTGIAVLFVTQGLAGTAGLAVIVWLVAVTVALHRSGVGGRALIAVTAVCAAVAVVPFTVGLSAAVLLLAIVPLVVVGIRLLVGTQQAGAREPR